MRSRRATPRATVPDDFRIEIIAGGLMPSQPRAALTVDVSGLCEHVLRPRWGDPVEELHRHFLSDHGVALLYRRFARSRFRSVDSADAGFVDGDYVQLTVRLDGAEHVVLRRNAPESTVERLVAEVNELMPDEMKIAYNALLYGRIALADDD